MGMVGRCAEHGVLLPGWGISESKFKQNAAGDFPPPAFKGGVSIQKDINILTVDINGLMNILSCGEFTARKIGAEAGARVVIGRRVLYNVNKVKEYLNEIAE